MNSELSDRLIRVREDIDGSPAKNPYGGFTVGYICEADPTEIASKSAQLTLWGDIAFVAFDLPGIAFEESTMALISKYLRKGDILLVPTHADIDGCSESLDLIEQDGVVVTVLEGLTL